MTLIESHISEFDKCYRKGPSLYFYERCLEQRAKFKTTRAFLNNNSNIELIYATLVSWDMNSRGAKMKYYDLFRDNIVSCIPLLDELEQQIFDFGLTQAMFTLLENVYTHLDLMITNRKLVSNSKFLHFVYPQYLMPMDGKHTLEYFYGNHTESANKYIEIIDFSFEIMNRYQNLNKYARSRWNTTYPKMIDNAILYRMKFL